MPVIAMRVVKAEKHPNADRLRVYSFEGVGGEALQVVANLTNVYEVGDVAAVATVGTILKENGETFEIQPTQLRKVDSFGMALGKTTAEIGTNLTQEYGGNE